MVVVNLQIFTICFLDACSFGLFVPILSGYIIGSLQGSHTIVGVLAAGHSLMQIIASPFIRSITDKHGKKIALTSSLAINLLSYIYLGITSSYIIALLLRWAFTVTNQTSTLCKYFLQEHNDQENQNKLKNLLNICTVAGLVVGPIVGGQLFELDNGFLKISLLATLMILVCLVLAMSLPNSAVNEAETTSFLQKVREDIKYSLSQLSSIDIVGQWDVILLKTLYHTSTTVFFIKFSLLLKEHFSASSTVVGYTYAYQSILNFFAVFVSGFLRKPDRLNIAPPLFIMTASTYGMCFGFGYDIYLLCFIVMILAHSLLVHYWQKLFEIRSTEQHNIKSVGNTVGKIVSVFIPIVFGISCDLYGVQALQAFVLVPLMMDILIVILCRPEIANTPLVKQD